MKFVLGRLIWLYFTLFYNYYFTLPFTTILLFLSFFFADNPHPKMLFSVIAAYIGFICIFDEKEYGTRSIYFNQDKEKYFKKPFDEL